MPKSRFGFGLDGGGEMVAIVGRALGGRRRIATRSVDAEEVLDLGREMTRIVGMLALG